MYFTPIEYNQMVVKRTRLLRLRSGWSQVSVAKVLMLSVKTYQNYEYRSPLPSRYQIQFCELMGVTAADFTSSELTKFDVKLLRLPHKDDNRIL